LLLQEDGFAALEFREKMKEYMRDCNGGLSCRPITLRESLEVLRMIKERAKEAAR